MVPSRTSVGAYTYVVKPHHDKTHVTAHVASRPPLTLVPPSHDDAPDDVLRDVLLTLGRAADTARLAGDPDTSRLCVQAAIRVAALRRALHAVRQERAA